MVGQRVSHYRIFEELGGGGMGVVYKAEDTRLGRAVAVKFLSEELSRDQDALRRFQREARAASSLNHPNICTIHEIDEHDGRQFIVMELMEGQTLKDRIGGRPLPVEEIVPLVAQICEGLAAAHARGIIHRDIKPANLFVTQQGQVKVLDFGVAKLLPREDDATVTGTETAAAPALGTLAYMAPEQLNREPVDARTDIYALGCVLYEMATGQRPFARESGAQRITSILTRMPPPPSQLDPHVPAWLDPVILRCLEKNPGKRYASAKELQAELQGGVGRIPATSPRPEPRGSEWVRRRRVIASAGVVLLVAVLVILNVGGLRDRFFAAAPPKIDSIAVLPLKNLMGDPEQDYFVEGMREALTAEISKISALRVISRTSTMRYKETDKVIPQIAQELGVTGLIEGSVLREGDQVRIAVQLIHGPSDRHLWANNFDRQLRGILALHSEVAQAIAREIHVKVSSQERDRLTKNRPVIPEAHEAYLRARYHWNRYEYQEALEASRQAVQADPTYAPAYTALADAYYGLSSIVLPPEEAIPKARAAAQQALELDDSLAEAYASLGNIRTSYDWDWTGAREAFERALARNPNYATAHLWYGVFLLYVGRIPEALQRFQAAERLDPLSPVAVSYGAWCLFLARRHDEAIPQARRAIGLERDFFPAHLSLGLSFENKGLLRDALAEYETAASAAPRNEVPVLHRARVLVKLGRRAEAIGIVEAVKTRSAKNPAAISYHLGLVYLALGKREEALQWLERAYQSRSEELLIIKSDPALDSLRSDPRFQELLLRMKFPV